MLPFDTRNFTDAKREAMAWKVRNAADFRLPTLQAWNYDLCRVHRNGWEETVYDPDSGEDVTRLVRTRPKPGCRECGVIFRQHQRIGVAWLYLKKKALLADTMGSGKTAHAAGLLALMAETGELGFGREAVGRAIIVVRSPAIPQWHTELTRMLPRLETVAAIGPKRKRIDLYLQNWHVLLIGPEMLREDHEMLARYGLAALITDDIDSLRHPETTISTVLDRLGRRADRYIIMTGTPLQKKLPEMHAVLDGIGGNAVFGDLHHFVSRYVRYETAVSGRGQSQFRSKQIVGYKNLGEFKDRVAPMVLRRTAADLVDVTLPTINPEEVYGDLYPAQRRKYVELQKGVLEIMRAEGKQVKHPTALARIAYGAQICAGLATLGEADVPGQSSWKLDWVMDKIGDGGDLGDEKVVIFADLKNTVRAMQARMDAAGIGYVTIWGEESKREARHAAQERFWKDPDCRVLIGTRAIEQSLNLQVARHLINIDTIMNPSRMQQLAGRIRRDGSAFQHVFVYTLISADTQESRYRPIIEREQALADHVWDENNELFKALSAQELIELITGR